MWWQTAQNIAGNDNKCREKYKRKQEQQRQHFFYAGQKIQKQKWAVRIAYQQQLHRKPSNEWTNAISRRHIFHRVCRFVCVKKKIQSAVFSIQMLTRCVWVCEWNVSIIQLTGILPHTMRCVEANPSQAKPRQTIHNFTYANWQLGKSAIVFIPFVLLSELRETCERNKIE